ncbi:MAG: serine/threonine-protein kinase [Acidobacteriota bacterium]|nr:serine/threonine-protein kinase [Acidobacteriota bacterium]
MSLSAGSRLGPYEILSPLGAGGMGEVYRAKDPRLGREVAVKVLPASFSNDPDRLRRFEQEARAAGLLNHPNITAVYDIGDHDGAPYVVTELLEGETLRSRLAAGALAPRKALDYAIQIARGLAAAHEKGIVHRDLKPENLFVTKDGRVKILDFGLAKLKQSESGGPEETNLPTGTLGTEPGVVLGTMGYMSPEQVRGRAADSRSDIFSFGAILHEMLSGRRAFQGDTAADTITAILTKEPPDLSSTNRDVHPGLDRIVRHCLEKNAEERFQSASDLAFDLEALSGISATGAISAAAAPAKKRRLLPLLVPLALMVGAAAGVFAGRKLFDREPPVFHQLTFRRGTIGSARFGPDGQTILYGASWEGKPIEPFLARSDTPESRAFGVLGADVLGVSSSGEIALSLGNHFLGAFTNVGTLARATMAGGSAPREVLEEVQWADWSPDGQKLAVVREAGVKNRLEYPIGKVFYESEGWISSPRVSPDGSRIAFFEHPARADNGGSVTVVDAAGKKETISPLFASSGGLAWAPNGREVWFTAAPVGANQALYAASLAGQNRVLGRVTGSLTLHDVSRDGRALVTHDNLRVGIVALLAGEDGQRDLSWLDWGTVRDASPDGTMVLFEESGEGGGPGYSVYVRKSDGSPAIRLGEGAAQSFSPDGKSVLAIVRPVSDPQLVVYPIGPGEAKPIPQGGLKPSWARWHPDGKRIVVQGRESGRGVRLYLQDLAGGKPRPFTPEGYRANGLKPLSPDGRSIVVIGPERTVYLYPIEGGEPTPLPALTFQNSVVGWSPDARALYHSSRGVPLEVHRMDIATGADEVIKELMPSDHAGVESVGPVLLLPDRKSYVFGYVRILSDLHVVDGLK